MNWENWAFSYSNCKSITLYMEKMLILDDFDIKFNEILNYSLLAVAAAADLSRWWAFQWERLGG